MATRHFAAAALAIAVFAALPYRASAQEQDLAKRNQPAGDPDKPADVPVRRVVLFSSGVGFFQHAGTVRGDGSTDLLFKSDQINDILKSLVLEDLDGGAVSTVTYPSQDPLAKQLKSFGVDIAANPSLGDLLLQLRGSEVTVRRAGEELSGTILGVEKRRRPVEKGEPIVEDVINLLAGGRIVSVLLPELLSIELKDPKLQGELNRALMAVAGARDQDKKPVSIRFSGQGDRRVKVGYVVETPVWKTSYRLLMGDKPSIQGWAIVENQTDNDWTDVQLSLVSGRPMSFVQDLQQPLYVTRPVVVPELYASLSPRRYDQGLAGGRELAEGEDRRNALGLNLAKGMGGPRAEAMAAPPPRASMRFEIADAAEEMDLSASIQSIASAAQVGELFEYAIGDVSLPRQKSAMLPIVTDAVELRKVSIYNESVLEKNPLNGVRLTNTTGKHLLAGPVTVFEGNGYAGDAQIDNLPPGQDRLLSYGIDLQTRVNASEQKDESSLVTAKLVKGVLQLTRKDRFSQVYAIENKSDMPRTMVIEHPVRQGWSVVETIEPAETTEELYRFETDVAAGESVRFPVTLEQVRGEGIALLPMDVDALLVYSRTGGIPQPVKDALTRAAELKREMAGTQEAIGRATAEIARITGDQDRIRRNLNTPNTSPDYRNRLAKTLDVQETQLEELNEQLQTLEGLLVGQQAAYEQYLVGLNIG